MDSSILVNECETLEHHFSRAQSLERAFQEALRNTELIVRDEGTRRLRLRILMLVNENDDLHEQLALADDRIDLLEQEYEDIRSQLDQAHGEASRQDNNARLLSRDLQILKAELESMNGITTDSAKLLKEKLAISRELASLKPEIEYLRTQALHQQSILAKKLALERQISTLEVELAAEKRAFKHATQKNNTAEREATLQQLVDDAQADLSRLKREGEKALRVLQTELDMERQAAKFASQKSTSNVQKEAELQQQLAEVQRELAREKREANKDRKDAEKELKTSEAREMVIGTKLDQAQAKLRSAKEQLKESQTELAQLRTAAGKLNSAKPAISNRKRSAGQLSTDATIGTLDGAAARGKKPSIRRSRMDQTAVGEKSTFSITPFLNRAVNMTTDTPGKDQEVEDEESGGEMTTTKLTCKASIPLKSGLDARVSSSSSPPQVTKRVVSRKVFTTSEVLGESTATVKNRKPFQKKLGIVSSLEKLAEEADENEQPRESAAGDPQIPVIVQMSKKQQNAAAQNNEGDDGGQKKKKRKLLGIGKTLFDEEDGEASKRPAKITLDPSRLLGRRGLAGLKAGQMPALAAASALGSFSPLKKDRRGIGASFLG